MHQMIEDNLCVRLEALVRNVLLSPSRKLNIRRRLSVFMLLWCQFIGMNISVVKIVYPKHKTRQLRRVG